VHALLAELRSAEKADVPTLRAIRRRWSKKWAGLEPAFVIEGARALAGHREYRWIAFELVRFHRAGFASLSDETVSGFAQGLDSWESVDAFGRTLTGPAWAAGSISDALVGGWARSSDRWLRRAALVTAIEIGSDDRAIALCRHLAADRDDMVEKALSWTLRELVKRDRDAARSFLDENAGRLGARVRREVGNKLRTGLKNPRTPAS